jgi:hypothetical protein
VSPVAPRAETAIRLMIVNAGVLNARKMNIPEYLSRAREHGFAIKVPEGWELTRPGRAHVTTLVQAAAGDDDDAPPEPIKKLRDQLKQINNAETRAFVEEAVEAAERKLYRSAVVLSWVGAVAMLYDYVVANKLSDFNTEAVRRDAKWKPAKNQDGLARMGEFDFLQILQAIGVIGKSVREELEGCLKLRNGCGHPNSLRVADNRVASHIEVLVLNVFEKF